MKTGIVSLVGAGPGDPELITLKGRDRLKKADVVIYDYLANPFFLKSLPKSARKIYAGKKGSSHSREQNEINDLMIAHARKGRAVVRLKGGDPFLFGRGGEEAEALAAAGVPFEIVPGVTSAIGVPAYAGIPVTHRDYTSSVAFVTGHDQRKSLKDKQEDKSDFPPDWKALAKIGTVVFLMGYSNTPKIARRLIKAGRSPQTPVAVIEWGTYPQQRKVVGTLATIAQDLKKTKIGPPTVIVVGDVVSLSEDLSWYNLPLAGKKILVTRSRSQASELTRLLRAQGAEVIECPTIDILPPRSWEALDRSLQRLKDYDDLIFTSANAVRFFFGRFQKKHGILRLPQNLKISVVGSATASALKLFGFRPQILASPSHAEALLRLLLRRKMNGRRILFPRGREGKETLVEGLRAAGAFVDQVDVYRSLVPAKGNHPLLSREKIDALTFASSLTVENFTRLVAEKERRSLKSLLLRTPAFVIGPMTAETARKEGFRKIVQSSKPAMPDLVSCLVDYFRKKN